MKIPQNILFAFTLFTVASINADSHFESSSLKNDAFSLYAQATESLVLRNPYGSKANIESAHFSYWYDNSDSEINSHTLVQQLEVMEAIYYSLIIDRQYLDPIKNAKMNIYMEDAGGIKPDGDIDGVYVGEDPDGYLFIYMTKRQLSNSDEHIRALLSHEFFHTIQFEYIDKNQVQSTFHDYFWFQEGSASWGSYDAWNDPELFSHWGLWAQAIKPELTLTYSSFDNYSEAPAQHMYGTSLFLYWITHSYTGPNFIQQVLLEMEKTRQSTEVYPAPLDVMNRLLTEEYGLSLKTIYSDYAAHNILWDYPSGESYREFLKSIDIKLDSHLSESHSTISSNWRWIKKSVWNGAPQSWGASYIRLNTTGLDEIELSFHGESKGRLNSNGEWRLTLVMVDNEQQISYLKIDLDDTGNIFAKLINTKEFSAIYLSATVFATKNDINETFNFAYQLSAQGESTKYQPEVKPELLLMSKSGGSGAFGFLILLVGLINIYRFVIFSKKV